ncbi:chitinase [Rhypophila decipiens]|uniref:Chitinase n=1 Tax=Rhypophila decipiens TaxID=261697 RepID=A0AAN6YM52_9PEZI|nr:chitinase [Rhypophila decipiens]
MPPIPNQHVHTPRIITYYQTHHTPSSEEYPDGKHISILPLLQQPGISLTHVILAAIHINSSPSALTLNDHPPSHPRFTTLWAELRVLQASGIKVLGMLGGAAKGTFSRLDCPQGLSTESFEAYYAPLKNLITQRGLDGLDLDVEEPMSLAGIIHLIDRLKADFGEDFIITLAPVASALLDAKHNLSGFDYQALEVLRGGRIDWYNAQFYCGWGDCSNPVMYEMILLRGWKAEKVVVGLVTNPENGGGYVPWEGLGNVLPLLVGRHARFGGVMGWEYFNSLPGGRERPWEWARCMTGLVRGRRVVNEEEEGGQNGSGGMSETGNGKGTDMVEADADAEAGGGGGKEAPVPDSFEYFSDGATGED